MLKGMERIKRFLVLAIAILPIISTTSLQAATFGGKASLMPFISRTGAFSIKMPGQPVYKSRVLRTETGSVTAHSYVTETDGGRYAYMVMYGDLNFDPARVGESVIIDRVRDGCAKGVNGRVVAEKNISVNGYPGKIIRVEAANYVGINKIVLVGRRVYQIGFGMAKGIAFPSDVVAFLDSFNTTTVRNTARY
ncbi:MAG TPA: hypothetical protein VNN73_06370 [Blastocatellia bacterium]|nr:hypothetical protein [Blastocatellia bacterium]